MTSETNERRVSYIELFFDLVFVFGITQVTSLVHDAHTVLGLAQGLLMLATLWWTWSVYTWTTNWTGTDHTGIKVSLLAAMAASLIMAAAVPHAFAESGRLFAVFYFAVRAFGQLMYWMRVRTDVAQRAAVLTYLPVAMAAPVIVLIGGFLDQPFRTIAWTAGLATDLVAAALAGRGTWNMSPGHFAERNCLFVLIAFGESIVAIGFGAVGGLGEISSIAALLITFVGAAVLWWSYFEKVATDIEHYFREATDKEQGRFARDGYTFLHFPIVLGIVLYAVAAPTVVSSPFEALSTYNGWSAASGAALVQIGVAAMSYRAFKRLPLWRVVTTFALLVLPLVAGTLDAIWFTSLLTGVVTAGLIWGAEHKPADVAAATG